MRKKRVIYGFICIVMLIIAIIALIAALIVTGSGFLDLSNIARGIFVFIAIACGTPSKSMGCSIAFEGSEASHTFCIDIEFPLDKTVGKY